MRRSVTAIVLGLAVALWGLAGCGDDDDNSNTNTAPTCDPACGECQSCDTSAATPVCVDNCASDLECQDGQCVAPADVACDPACGACQMCDTTDAAAVCVGYCAEGTTCQDSQCVAPVVVECDPVCGDCQMCDTSGTDPECVDLCSEGLECDAGACVIPDDPCGGTCADCETCETSYGVPTCVDDCGLGTACDTTDNVCRPTTAGAVFDHSTLPGLAGPFTTDATGGRAVTAQCLNCHAQSGEDFVHTAHYTWVGPTPNLQGGAVSGTVGKRNLVNNFCVAVPSNERRCSQCHAGYGYKDDTFDFGDTANIDCLVCHSPNYAKHKTTAGGPDTTVDMVLAAQTVGRPTRATCGRCHFKAGGGDNVKKGDLGSSLTAPTSTDVDVHMGAANPFNCSSCHQTTGHQIPGQGLHLPVAEGRVGCNDCHSDAPHASAQLNNHSLDIACQTCHIPTFSRQLPTKMDWDWSTAGDRTRGTNGVEMGTLPDSTEVKIYDAMKGDFVWQKEVRPAYAWYDGRVKRTTLMDAYPAGAGTMANPIDLGSPIAGIGDAAAKIYPFKLMTGRQPVDTTTLLMLAPKLFGPGGFWGSIPAAGDYDAAVVEANWTNALTLGARVAGQIGATDTFTGRATGAMPWDWAYTEMWMSINHEVAPATDALGCADCHFGAANWDWTALGYSCDPATDPLTCGSRHP